MRWKGRAVVVGLVLLAAVAGVAPTAVAGVASTATQPGSTSAQSQPTTDSTVTRITVAENGSAAWVVQVRTRLDSQADVENYETFQERFRANRSRYLDPFSERMRGVVADAAEATGRPMRARRFRATTSIQTVPRRWGLVTYEFRWSAFAARDGESLVVGDVFRGRFFLTENDTLEVTGPAGFTPERVAPEPAERDPRTVRWFGRRAFADDRPLVRFVPVSTATRSNEPGTGTAGPGGTGEGVETAARTTDAGGTLGSGFWLFVAVLVAGLLAVGTVGYWRATRGPGAVDSGADDGATRSSAGGSESAAPGPSGSGSAPVGDDDSAVDGARAAGAVEPSPVVADEERVRELLDEHGGQLKQSDIVEAFDWSKSKTSRVLSEMAEEGTVEKLRLGRENVIRLQSADPADGTE